MNQHQNPTSNTDIELSYSDNGGLSWTDVGVVNDDDSDVDGYSGADVDTGTFGRTQFQPEIAVDQATGTLVVSWRDARDDAANARVATYLTTSIDGGNSFSPQTYANPAQTATDDITGQTDILGPEPTTSRRGTPRRTRRSATATRWGWPSSTARSIRSGRATSIRARMSTAWSSAIR